MRDTEIGWYLEATGWTSTILNLFFLRGLFVLKMRTCSCHKGETYILVLTKEHEIKMYIS